MADEREQVRYECGNDDCRHTWTQSRPRAGALTCPRCRSGDVAEVKGEQPAAEPADDTDDNPEDAEE